MRDERNTVKSTPGSSAIHPRRLLVAQVSATVVLALAGALSIVAPAHAADSTVVSLTFDDGNADTVAAAPIMNAAGMHGTYYTNSGNIGLPGFQTRADLSSLYAAGNEIAGHTVNHPDLTTLSTTEAKRQICLDRDTLLGWGFPVQNFAYPFAATNASVDTLAQACGYNSARNLGDIQSRFGCAGCDYAESIPPAKPYELAALDEFDSTWTLADLESTVTNAQNNGGGWVILTFHHLCSSNCDSLSISPALFSQFVSWLSTQSANSTVVKTVADVIGGTTQSAVVVPPGTTSTTVTNPSFETINTTTNLPNCWAQAGYGTNTAAYTTVSPGHTGNVAARLRMTAYTDGDSKVMPLLDLGSCSPSAIPGTSYQLGAWYTSTTNTQFEVYLRTTSGGWVYWDASPYFAPATAWTAASWVTQPVPAGYDGIDFALTLFSVGTLTTDDYSISNSASVTTPPVTTATVSPAAPNGLAGWYTTTPTVTLSAGTPSAGQVTQYSYNGTTWSTYSAPIAIPAGISTLYYRTINTGFTEATHTLAFKVDSTAPVVSPAFNAATRTYSATATDAGSGVASIQQSVSGGPWTTYAGPTVTSATAKTISFRATDVAGNISASVPLVIGAATATTTATVNPASPNGLLGWYTVAPVVTLSAGTTGGGQVTQYSLNGVTWSTYTAPITIPNGSWTLRYRTISAGVTEPTRTLAIKADTVAPQVSASLRPIRRTVTATASDVGSGVASILWRISGGTWATYTGPVPVGSQALTLDFQSEDVAGLLSAIATVAVPAR
jgi:peptidoglycan/xylan/chitin deacetylase (PgdA/CDA1 family)